MEKYFAELISLHTQLIQQRESQDKTLQLFSEKLQQLAAHLGADVDAVITPKLDAEVQEAQLPEHVSVQWAADYLDIHRSNFYRNVDGKLLFRVLQIGIRPYYLKSDVVSLMAKHEKGAHTFSKMAKKKKG
ncbi:hypothetical protein [Sphingobacterium pedocola]|uniref:Helix-turn-helix domain-containing protein n=1 Tax=Sphingobacterium pedocola TaxID=2082722 RepID=A0ABR9T8B1_9SPHI|nr:hypothetical protein [Sphingobacterium pedocola]MBE8721571.1 hypothetical protein [Sphingobacterium pedocola]